jgi:uncharacterized protein YabN with tetrapyrrole methylase and pyrophosphatase domain
VIFHAQLASERGVFDFDEICRRLAAKLVRRHPHVFGDIEAATVDQVWANWEKIKKAEKAGSIRERKSALDGVPKHLPALMRVQKLIKKALKAGLETPEKSVKAQPSKAEVAKSLFELARLCQDRDWSAEELLGLEASRREKAWRLAERKAARENPI